MDGPAKTRRGRPRHREIDERALEAARRVLVEEGYASTTIPRVAERAGLHSSALYRRWPSRIEMIQEAAFGNLAPRHVRATGDLRRDLTRFLRSYVAALDAPLHRAALPALIGPDAQDRPRAPEAWAELSIRPHFRRILESSKSVPVESDIDSDDIFDLVLGAAMVHAFVPSEARAPAPIERTVDLILRILKTARTESGSKTQEGP